MNGGEQDWTGIILQWLFLFGVLAIFTIPGWFYGNLAKKNNQSRWPFVIAGTGVFIIAIISGKQLGVFIGEYFESQQESGIASLIQLTFAIATTVLIYFALKSKLDKNRVMPK